MKYSLGDKLKVGLLCDNPHKIGQYLKSIAFAAPVTLDGCLAVDSLKVDVVFIDDVYMDWESVNQFDVPVIFLAKDKTYSYEALKFGVADMILQPYDQKDIEEAILKAMYYLRQRYLGKFEAEIAAEDYPRIVGVYFQFKSIKQSIISVDFRKIRFCVADGNLTYIMLNDHRKEVGNFTISHGEKVLQDFGFVKIHRKYVVNPTFVESVIDLGQGKRFLNIAGYDKELPISRRRWKEFKQVFGQEDHL